MRRAMPKPTRNRHSLLTLTGNTLWMGYEHDLLVEDATSIVAGPNNFDRNPGYIFGRTRARGRIAFRRMNDCTLSGLHVTGIHHHAAAVLLVNTTLTRVSGLVIRDDRTEVNPSPALTVVGGYSNTIVGNSLDRRAEIAPKSGRAHDHDVTPRVPGVSVPAAR